MHDALANDALEQKVRERRAGVELSVGYNSEVKMIFLF